MGPSEARNDWLAVKTLEHGISPRSLKRDALLFEQILVPRFRDGLDHEVAAELEWLEERGIVSFIDPAAILGVANEVQREKWRQLMVVCSAAAADMRLKDGASFDEAIAECHLFRNDFVSRILAFYLSMQQDRTAIPLFVTPWDVEKTWRYISEALTREVFDQWFGDNRFVAQLQGKASLHTPVLQVTLNRMPIPNDATPWEQVIEFRSDPDSRNRVVSLRRWVRDVAKRTERPSEIAEELEDLLARYDGHMRFHNMKLNRGLLETLVTTSASVAEDLLKLKWGKLAECPFQLRMLQVELIGAELTAPGREVAYITKTRQHFAR